MTIAVLTLVDAVEDVTGLQGVTEALFDLFLLGIGLFAGDGVIENVHIGSCIQRCGVPMDYIEVKSFLVNVIAECGAVGVARVLAGQALGGVFVSLPTVICRLNDVALNHSGM